MGRPVYPDTGGGGAIACVPKHESLLVAILGRLASP